MAEAIAFLLAVGFPLFLLGILWALPRSKKKSRLRADSRYAAVADIGELQKHFQRK